MQTEFTIHLLNEYGNYRGCIVVKDIGHSHFNVGFTLVHPKEQNPKKKESRRIASERCDGQTHEFSFFVDISDYDRVMRNRFIGSLKSGHITGVITDEIFKRAPLAFPKYLHWTLENCPCCED